MARNGAFDVAIYEPSNKRSLQRGVVALMGASLLALAACGPQVPDSAAGIGDDTSPFNAPPAIETGQTLSGAPLVPPVVLSNESTGANANWQNPRPSSTQIASSNTASSQNVGSNDDIAREAAAAIAASSQNSGRTPIEASPDNPAPVLQDHAGISDENDFSAVASRQTIESDAERLARQRAQYQVVAPTAVPQRPSDLAPNIVSYALSTSNPRGQRVYSRAGINLKARAERNCAQYGSPDLAQTDFLEAGGPQRDRLVLDPDGDGYACGWDPAPFRAAVRAQGN